jgi:hypothetical protein
MSFLTGGCVELLYASLTAGTAASPAASTETQINDTTGMGVQARLEPDFWLPNNNQVTKAIHITARGLITTGATATNATFTVRGGVAGITGPILLATSASAVTASLSNQVWRMEGDVIVSVMGAAGAHSTVQGYGSVMTSAEGTTYPFPMTGTVATLDTSITNFINVNCLLSAAGNTITLQQLLIYGLN